MSQDSADNTENTAPNEHAEQPAQPDPGAKRLVIFEPYGRIARAIASQIAQIGADDRQVESVYVRAPQYSVGMEGEAFITETEREWWLVLEYGDLLQVTIREMDGTPNRMPMSAKLAYDRDEPEHADETLWAPPLTTTDEES